MSDFYRSFEDRFRGSEEEIAKRLRQYQPFVQPLVEAKLGNRAIDLGCGRGEWLRVLAELDQGATGVDLDNEMLQAARKSGLDVETADAIQFLRQQPDECAPIISAFHLVEHLSFESMHDLIREAYRCLIPGGVIILETPNPENLIVSSANFFLDPTHVKPVPPLQLSFVVESAGFNPVKIVRLQENAQLVNRSDLGLMDVLGGVSPDYAIVAQKKGNEALSIALSGAFGVTFGLELSTLASRYDDFMSRSIRETGYKSDQRVQLLQEELQAMSKRTDAMQKSIALLRTEIDHLNAKPGWRVFRRVKISPNALGRQDAGKNAGKARRTTDPVPVRLNRRLSRIVASWFGGDTKEAYRRLVETVNSSAGAAIGRRNDDLSPRADYFNDRLRAGPKGQEGR